MVYFHLAAKVVRDSWWDVVLGGIDILLPVHGRTPYLKETLKSLVLQESVEFRIVAVLDRASRETEQTLKEFNKAFPILVCYSDRPGVANALNYGLSHCEAELVARIDCDDIMMPDRLKSQKCEFDANPDLVLLGSNIQLIDEDGENLYIDYYPLSAQQIYREFTRRNPFAHPSVMFRKDSVIQVGGYRNFYEGAEDYDLWSRLIGVGTMKNSSNVLTKYRIHSGQVTRSNTNKSQIAFEAALLSYRLRILGRPELDQIYESQIEWYAKDEIKRRRLNLKRFPIVALMKDQSDTLRDRSEFVHQLSTIQKISRIARLLARHPISGTRRLYRQLRYRAEYMLLEIRKEIEEMRSDSKSKDSRKYFLALGLLGIFNPHEFAFRSKYKVREWEARKLHFANRKLSSFRTGIKGKKSFKYVIYVMLFVLIHPGLAMSKIRLASKRDNR